MKNDDLQILHNIEDELNKLSYDYDVNKIVKEIFLKINTIKLHFLCNKKTEIIHG